MRDFWSESTECEWRDVTCVCSSQTHLFILNSYLFTSVVSRVATPSHLTELTSIRKIEKDISVFRRRLLGACRFRLLQTSTVVTFLFLFDFSFCRLENSTEWKFLMRRQTVAMTNTFKIFSIQKCCFVDNDVEQMTLNILMNVIKHLRSWLFFFLSVISLSFDNVIAMSQQQQRMIQILFSFCWNFFFRYSSKIRYKAII